MKNVINELIFLLVTGTTHFDIRFGRYGILRSGSNSGQILDRLGHKCLIGFLGHKDGETCWALNTKTARYQLSFPTPTQTYVFDNRSNGYGCLGTAHMWSSAIAEKLINQRFGGLATISNGEDYIFYSCLLGLLIK
jgi:hypothetical protein